MKKLFNLRLPVLYALSLAAGILYSAFLAYFKLESLYIAIPVAVEFAACLLYGLIKKNTFKFISFLIAVLLFLSGAVYMYILYSAYCENQFLCGELVKVHGTVDETGTTAAGNTYIVLGNLSVNDEKVGGRLIAYLSDTAGDFCRKGYTAEFFSQLTKESFITDGHINYNAIDGIKYSCNIFGSLKAEYGFSLFGEINYALQENLFTNLEGETAAVAYAMLTGNTGHISAGTLSSFRYGGIAHIFAVSGLHIGVIYGALSLVFKKIGVNRFASAAVRVTLIILFAGICNFSPSSVRAVTMCSVLTVASCTYRKYDSLNSLALAAIIILLINPLHLFGAGFILSFSAILGLLLISDRAKRIFSFLPDKICESVSVGVCAQLGTMPAGMAIFGYVSVAGLALNLVLIPLISAFYVELFFGAILSVAIPSVGGAVLPVVCTPLSLLINFVVSCGFENAIISGEYGAFVYIPYIALVLITTDRINLPFKWRAFFSLAVSSLLLAVVSSDSPRVLCKLTFGTGYDGGFVFVTNESGNILIVTEDCNGGISGYSDKADSIVVLGGDYSLSAVFNNVGAYRDAYLRGGLFPIEQVGPVDVHYSDRFTLHGVSFRFEGDDLYVEIEGITFTVTSKHKGDLYGDIPEEGVLHLHSFENQRTVLFCENGDSYGLDICGEMRYTIYDGRCTLHSIIPKE